MSETPRERPSWPEIRARVLAEPLICFGMTVREARPDDADAVAGMLGDPPPARRGAPAPAGNARLAAHMIREGSAFVVEDDERRPMGLVSLRDGTGGRVRAGWTLEPGRLGKGLGAILAEGVAARLFSAGAATVLFEVQPGSRAARRALEDLGFAPAPPDGRPVPYEADAGAFSARRRRGVALLPTPAERRRGPSPGEQAVVGPPRDPHALSLLAGLRAFSEPLSGDGITLTPARLVPAGELAALAPDRERALDPDRVLVAGEAGGERFGILAHRILPDGAFELGWHVAPARRGEGLGTRMAALAAGRLLDEGVERLACVVGPGDGASRRLAERVGFVPDGGRAGSPSMSLRPGGLLPPPASPSPPPR